MQNKDVKRPYFSVHTLPQTQKQVRRSRMVKKTNVKLKNINVAKQERSRSTPHGMRFAGKFRLNSAMFRSQHQQKSIKEAPSPTRQSKLRFGRNTLKLSLQIIDDINSPPPIVVAEPEEVVKEAQKRRSCDCTECGKQTIFQKDTMNYGVKINQVMREQESAINKFKRSIRKQQTLLFPQFLNTPKNSNNNNNEEFPLEEIEIMRDDLMIKSFAHRPTLSNFVFEEQITVNKSNTLHTERPKLSFFESFLQKQKQIINFEKTQFTRQKVLLDSLHNRCNVLSTHIKIHSPQVLTPRSPASLIMTSFPSTSPVKRKQQPANIYLQPQKSKFFKTNSRITTLPEVPQQI